MAYTPQTWTNSSGGGTPLSATRLNYMEAGIAGAGGGGGGTLVVYASNALDPQGDYMCDGVADQVQINAAINALPTIGGGLRGTIYLSEGDYAISSAIVVPANADIEIRGVGSGGYFLDYGTKITLTGTTNAHVFDLTATFADLSLRSVSAYNNATGSGSVICLSNGDIHVEQCTLRTGTNVTGSGIYFPSSDSESQIFRSQFYCRRECIKVGPVADVTWNMIVDGCYFYVSGTGYCIDLQGSNGTVDGNLLDNGGMSRIVNCLSDGNAEGFIKLSALVTNLLIANNASWYDTVPAISATNAGGLQILGNNFGDGSYVGGVISLNNCQDSIVSNNIIYKATHDGIVILDSDDIIVQGNQLIQVGNLTNNTYTGIKLDGDTNQCLVSGNMMRSKGAANKLQYGIRIDDATCNDNLVYGNDVLGAYVTTGVSDAGTGTITTASNRT